MKYLLIEDSELIQMKKVVAVCYDVKTAYKTKRILQQGKNNIQINIYKEME